MAGLGAKEKDQMIGRTKWAKAVNAHGIPVRIRRFQTSQDIDLISLRYESYCRFSKKIKHKPCNSTKEEQENSKKNRQ